MKRFISQLSLMIPFLFICIWNASAHDESYYLDLLKYGTDSDIEKAFSRVNKDLGEKVNRRLLDIFNEEHAEKVYLSIVSYIGMIGLKEANEVLLQELSRKGRNEDYRETVIRTIGVLKKSSSLLTLTETYNSTQTSLRMKKAIIDSFGEIGDRNVEEMLIGIADDEYEDVEVRAHAVLALGKIKSEKSILLLQNMLHNVYEEKILRMYAASSLSQIGGVSSLSALAKVINDDSHEVAEYAVNGIAQMERIEGAEFLIKALRSDYDKVRYYAVIGLGKLKYHDAVEALKFRAAYDVNDTVRKEAQKVLENMQRIETEE